MVEFIQIKKCQCGALWVRAQRKSKSPVAWDRGAEFVIRSLRRHRVHPFQPALVASHFSSLPNSAIARRGTAKTVRSAVPRGKRAPPLRATSRERLPALCASRPASGNKSDKVVADFVFVPAREMVPEKTSRTLRDWGDAGNPACAISVLRRNRSASRASQRSSNAAPLPRRFPGC